MRCNIIFLVTRRALLVPRPNGRFHSWPISHEVVFGDPDLFFSFFRSLDAHDLENRLDLGPFDDLFFEQQLRQFFQRAAMSGQSIAHFIVGQGEDFFNFIIDDPGRVFAIVFVARHRHRQEQRRARPFERD